MPDFTAHLHPVLAVRCPDCGKAVGLWCIRPSGHRASDLHVERRIAADRVFVDRYGTNASIARIAGEWTIDPRGRIGILPHPESTGTDAETRRQGVRNPTGN